MSSTTYRQELPPPKGYQKIIYERIPVKGPWKTWQKLLLLGFLGVAGSYNFRTAKMRREDDCIERKAAQLALGPLLNAEKDRLVLKHLKKMRDEEADLMKNVPGWETGTLYGEPIFKTVDPKDWYELYPEETYIHAHPLELDYVLLHTRFG